MTRLTTLLFLTTIFIFTVTCCSPIRDCGHHFIYQGKIETNDSLLKENLVIRFENLGDIISKSKDKFIGDTSAVDNNGDYKVVGDFMCSCESGKITFDVQDSLRFQIVRKGQVIKTGKFKILQFARQDTDSAFHTTLKLPTITIN